MNKFSLIYLILNLIFFILLPAMIAECSMSSSTKPASAAAASLSASCKELNQWNCYSAKNEGYFCNRNDQTKSETRWYYDKGQCRKFAYKGCNGNRNRFCSNETCLKRCQGE